jgi:hypothetical protein
MMMQRFLEVAGAWRNPCLGRCGARVQDSQVLGPGGVGAPPGGTTAPCQELADDRAGEFPRFRSKARPGAETRTPRRRAGRRPHVSRQRARAS